MYFEVPLTKLQRILLIDGIKMIKISFHFWPTDNATEVNKCAPDYM